ncbi:aldehyde dehydrogenase family protein [Actinacidiphila glaucinigra]|uniref:aldehyde dehydrogenase family protein n=1 Tax=Actinacidiphila glaucinigra TaxID=235986 RepID=UPI00370D7A2D
MAEASASFGGGERPAGEGLDEFDAALAGVVDDASGQDVEHAACPVAARAGDGEDEAVRLANDSAYGLAGTVWTADPEHGTSVARRIRSGTVGINGYVPDIGSPYGGMKSSGLGRELGPEGLQAYQQLQSVYQP